MASVKTVKADLIRLLQREPVNIGDESLEVWKRLKHLKLSSFPDLPIAGTHYSEWTTGCILCFGQVDSKGREHGLVRKCFSVGGMMEGIFFHGIEKGF